MSFGLKSCLLFVVHAVAVSGSNPVGHGKPLGEHAPPVGDIAVVDDFPHPLEFYKQYVKPKKPVLFKGVLNRIKFPAYTKWTDEYMKETFGDVVVQVEEGKKENRSNGMEVMTLKMFLILYKRQDRYLVQDLSYEMKEDIYLPRCLQCGGFSQTLAKVVAWFSSGGTKSVLHNDEFDNINCLLDGSKQIVFIDKKEADVIEKDGWLADGSYHVVDIDSVDMYKYPAFRDIPWYSARMEKGDCLFIPNGWYHQVNSFGDRNLAVNIWFYPITWFNRTDCAKGNHMSDGVGINEHLLVSIMEYARNMLLSLLPDVDIISEEEFHESWEEVLPNNEIQTEVFEKFDTNKDGLLSWDELYAFNVTEFVESYKKYLGNDFMAGYRRILDEGGMWDAYSQGKPQSSEKEEL